MLPDQYPTVNAGNSVFGESFLEHLDGGIVVDGLVVGRYQYGIVDDKEIGISGRQTEAVLIIDGFREWKRKKPVRLVLPGYGMSSIVLPQPEFVIVFVFLVFTFYVDDGIVRTEAGQRIDMAVGIVTGKIAVIKPQYTFGMQQFFELLLNVCPGQMIITVGGEQAFCRGQQRTAAVTFDRTALRIRNSVGYDIHR